MGSLKWQSDGLGAGVLLSTAFLLMFAASSGIDNLETSVLPAACHGCAGGTAGICQHGDVCVAKISLACDEVCPVQFEECTSPLGRIILGLSYLTFMLSAIGAPVVPKLIGERMSMVLGSFAYAVYGLVNWVAAMFPDLTALHYGIMLPASVLMGVSSSVIWVAQASYLTKLAATYAGVHGLETPASALGLFNGIFFATYNCSKIAGNLLSSIVLGVLAWPTTSLFIVYMGIAASGTALLSLLPRSPLISTETDPLLLPEKEPSASSWKSLFVLAKDSRIVQLVPLMIFHGLQQGFVTGEFTSYLVRPSLGSMAIGYVMAVSGVANVAGSVIFGRLIDRAGVVLPISIGFVASLVAYGLCFTLPVSSCDGQWTPILVVSVLLSVVDSATTTALNVVLGNEFRDNTLDAFALFRVYHAAAASASFFFSPLLTFHARAVIVCATGAVGVLSLVRFVNQSTRK